METQTLQFTMDLWQFFIAILVFVGTIGIAWGTLKTKVQNLEKDSKDLKENLQRMESKIENGFTEVRSNILNVLQAKTLGNATSPYKPSEEGEKLLKESGWNEIYPQIKKEIFQIMESIQPKTLYDVEKSAFYALDKIKDQRVFDPIKNYTVHNPKYSFDAALLVGSWIIREEYQNTHPEIK